jgi:cytidyltransferase-like protein
MAGNKVVIVSGYFDAGMHSGHTEYLRLAKEFAGDDGVLIAIVNNDQQALLKKGYAFVPQEHRLATVQSSQYVDLALLSIDTDRTVCKTIEMLCTKAGLLKPSHILNGGDVTGGCPEEAVGNAYGVISVYGFGEKTQSSSWIIRDSIETAYAALSK